MANTTLWYCHHHLFDLPHRPRFDRYWREAWEGYRAYNRAVADVVAERAADGATVLVQDYHFSLLGRMLAERRPDLRSVHFLHTPFAAPAMLGVLPDAVAAELLDGMAGYSACGFHCHRWEADFNACYAAAGRAGAAHVRRPARSRCRRARGGGGHRPSAQRRRPRCAPRWATAASSPGRPHGAVEEHRAGDAGLRGAPGAHPEWRGRGGARGPRLPEPARAGRVSRLRGRRGAHGRADQPRLRATAQTAGRPILLSMEDDRPRSLAALTLSDVLLINPVRDGLNLVAKEGPLLNTADGVLVLSHEAGAWEELPWPAAGARRQPLRRGGDGRRPPRGAVHGAPERARRAGRCGSRAGADVGRLVGGPAGRRRRHPQD